jgi:hypothetical protein
MRLTVRKDIAALRAAGIARVNAAAGQVRARFVTVIPAQDMVYLEKAAEARRYLTTYPAPEDEPPALDPSPELGFPFIAAEIGITAPSAYAVAQIYVQGAALFRQAGAAIETIRLGAVAAIEIAGTPAAITAAEAACAEALRLIPTP